MNLRWRANPDGYGLSVRKIAALLGQTSHIALNTYINKRGLQPAPKV